MTSEAIWRLSRQYENGHELTVLVDVGLVAAVEGGGGCRGGRRCCRLRHGGGGDGRDDVVPPRDEDDLRRLEKAKRGLSQCLFSVVVAGLSILARSVQKSKVLSWVGCFFLARSLSHSSVIHADSAAVGQCGDRSGISGNRYSNCSRRPESNQK